jgi:hypothetical protein
MVYYGKAAEAVEYFESIGHPCPKHYNPADFVIDLVTMNSASMIQALALKYKESRTSSEMKTLMHTIQTQENPYEGQSELIAEYASTWTTQFHVLAKRTLLHNLRNPYLIRTQYILTVALALLIGTIYWHVTDDIPGTQNRAGAMFFMIALLSFSAMSSIDTCNALFNVTVLTVNINSFSRETSLCERTSERHVPYICLFSSQGFL